MTVSVIGLSLLATAIGLAFHVLWWRVRRPRDDAAVLFFLMGGLPWLLTAGVLLLYLQQTGADELQNTFLSILLPLGLINTLIALVYMSCYTAAQAASPSVLIILACLGRPDGISREELLLTLDNDLLCGDLVQAGLDEKLIVAHNDRLELAPRGRFLLKLGRTLRRFLRLHDPVG
jgi:hypothetical protein